MNLACNCVHLWMPGFNMVVCTWSIGVIVVPRAKRKVSIEPGVSKYSQRSTLGSSGTFTLMAIHDTLTNLTGQKDRARIFETNLFMLGSVFYACCNPSCWTLHHTAWEKWKRTCFAGGSREMSFCCLNECKLKICSDPLHDRQIVHLVSNNQEALVIHWPRFSRQQAVDKRKLLAMLKAMHSQDLMEKSGSYFEGAIYI